MFVCVYFSVPFYVLCLLFVLSVLCCVLFELLLLFVYVCVCCVYVVCCVCCVCRVFDDKQNLKPTLTNALFPLLSYVVTSSQILLNFVTSETKMYPYI